MPKYSCPVCGGTRRLILHYYGEVVIHSPVSGGGTVLLDDELIRVSGPPEALAMFIGAKDEDTRILVFKEDTVDEDRPPLKAEIYCPQCSEVTILTTEQEKKLRWRQRLVTSAATANNLANQEAADSWETQGAEEPDQPEDLIETDSSQEELLEEEPLNEDEGNESLTHWEECIEEEE